MKINLNEIIGSLVQAKDGNIGKIADFYFDDHTWAIRYLIVDLGVLHAWRKVLISPVSFKETNWESKEFIINLTKDQVIKSPDIDTERPVTKQHERELHEYYDWPVYWNIGGPPVYGGLNTAFTPPPFIKVNEAGERVSSYKPKGNEPNLQSVKDVSGYDVQADGEMFGDVESFYIDDKTWVIGYILVNSPKMTLGKKILISPHWIKDISWMEFKIFLDLSIKAIKNCPPFVYSKIIDPEYEAKMCDYYVNGKS
jgi:uncharacterized protein YrrD